MAQSGRRIELIDFLRGGAMILVLLHHSGFPFGKWILAFHMPLFFILSGYTEAVKSNRSQQQFAKFLLKKVKRLIVPYFLFENINLLIWYIRCLVLGKTIRVVSPLISILLCINTDAYNGLCGRLWFLPCMFVSSIFFYLCKRYISNHQGLICVTGICFFVSWITFKLIPGRLPFTIDTAFMATAFLLVGYWGKTIIGYLLDNGHIVIDVAICLLMLGMLYSTYRTNRAGMLMYINEYGDYIYSILGSIGGSIAYLLIAKYLYYFMKRVSLLNNFVLWYSYNSLATFPVHLQIKCVLLLFGLSWTGIWWALFLVMLFGNIIIVNIITNYLPFLLGQGYTKNVSKKLFL